MVLILQTIIQTYICLVIFPRMVAQRVNPKDWRTIERVAEEHPYVVALLDGALFYMCTGTIINDRTVLTSGKCLKNDLKYVAVTIAAFDRISVNSNVFTIAFKRRHGQYSFQIKPNSDSDAIRMQNNIGLVLTVKPLLEALVSRPRIGNLNYKKLKKIALVAVGFGKINRRVVAIQKQVYETATCVNSNWNNCVCGIEEDSNLRTYVDQFGEGGPVLLGSVVIGIVSFPCASMSVSSVATYNVFTVIGPYEYWINNAYESPMRFISQEAQISSFQKRMEPNYLFLYLLIVQMCRRFFIMLLKM